MNRRNEALVDIAAKTESIVGKGNDAIRKGMAKRGSLNLPALLEARRWEFLIPDKAFDHAALYDRILILQLTDSEGETFGEDSTIIMPEITKSRLADEACRGVIVSAGLSALDHLRSNGADLGHVVRFIRNAPWRMKVDRVEGHDIHELVMRDGDLISSEDLAIALRKGQCKVAYVEGQHVFVDAKGNIWKPEMPFIQDDL